MIYFAQFRYRYDYLLALFVSTPNAQPAEAVLRKSETLFVVEPHTVRVLKNDEGPHYANMGNAGHDLEAPMPTINPTALMLVDEEELERYIAARCPSYYEWKWQTLREWQP